MNMIVNEIIHKKQLETHGKLTLKHKLYKFWSVQANQAKS